MAHVPLWELEDHPYCRLCEEAGHDEDHIARPTGFLDLTGSDGHKRIPVCDACRADQEGEQLRGMIEAIWMRAV